MPWGGGVVNSKLRRAGRREQGVKRKPVRGTCDVALGVLGPSVCPHSGLYLLSCRQSGEFSLTSCISDAGVSCTLLWALFTSCPGSSPGEGEQDFSPSSCFKK